VAATALEMGIADALATSPASISDLSAELELSRRGVEIVVRALAELGLVRDSAEGLRLTGAGRARLIDRDTPDFEGDALRFWLTSLRRWVEGLPEAVRTGAPQVGPEGRSPGGLAAFMAAMANKRPDLVDAAVEAVLRRAPEAATVLDLGGGPGTFARAFARRGLRAVLFDKPEVIEHVRGTYRLEEEPGLELRSGDFVERFPEGSFDVVLLGNITHIYDAGTNARLLARAARAVRPGGVLAILDFVRGESAFAALFAVTMLLNSRHGGGTYTRERYEAWLEEAGLANVRLDRLDEDRHLVTGVRPAGSVSAEPDGPRRTSTEDGS